MSRIRGKDTAPELIVRRAIWSEGFRYRLHDKQLPGQPDLVFPHLRTVILVHGCFWHAHEGCRNFRLPKTRTDWWEQKLMGNRARDEQVRKALEAAGWKVMVIWECETGDAASLAATIAMLKESAPK